MGILVMEAEGYGGPTILVVAPHADDETLGCGGLIAKSGVPIEVVVFGVTGAGRLRELEAAMEALNVSRCTVLYPDMDGLLDTIPMREMVADMDAIVKRTRPPEIYYCPAQHHQDHRVVAQVMSAVLRPWGRDFHPDIVATYELPGKSDFPTVMGGDLYVPLAKEDVQRKMLALGCYESQKKPWGPTTRGNMLVLAKLRGVECQAEYAERFKVIVMRR